MIRKMISLDWRAQKGYQIRYLVFLPYITFLCWAISILAVPVVVVMSMGFTTMPFFVEDRGDLNRLYLTLPVKRKSIVAGRFLLSLIILLCTVLICVPCAVIMRDISISKWYIGINGWIAVISFSYLLYAIINLSMYPLLFKLGYQKGKFWGFYLPFFVFVIIYLVYYIFWSGTTLTIEFITYASDNLLLVSGGMAVLATNILWLSYIISIKQYSKRDF